jgi:hypothetical protein
VALAPQGAEGGLGASLSEVEVVTDVVELCQLQLDHRVRVSFQLIGQLATSGLDTARLQRRSQPFSGLTRRSRFGQLLSDSRPPAHQVGSGFPSVTALPLHTTSIT